MFARVIFISAAYVCALTGPANGDVYLLKIRVVGYKDAVVGDKKPVEKVMRQLDVPVAVGVPFKMRLVNGPRILIAEGLLKTTKTGRLEVELKFDDLEKTDYLILGEDGKWKPSFLGGSFSVTLRVQVDKQTYAGGSGTTAERVQPDGSKLTLRSKTDYTLELVKWPGNFVHRPNELLWHPRRVSLAGLPAVPCSMTYKFHLRSFAGK